MSAKNRRRKSINRKNVNQKNVNRKAETVALIGYMGSGKSTVGRLLSRDLGLEFVDLDFEIEREAGTSIPEIFASSGESGFRDIEHDCLKSAVLRGGCIIACGGGLVTKMENLDLLDGVTTVMIEEDLEVLYERTRSAFRPLRGGGFEEFRARYEERRSLYRRAADMTVRSRGRGQAAIARELSGRLSK